MNELSLFSGAGGGLLATKHLLGWRTIGYVEWDDYCQRILVQRIKDGLLDEAPIFGDIRAFISEGYAERYRGMVDILTAGFPCQPFSVAGKQKGEQDDRNMWPQTIECIRIIRPRYAFLENVPGLLANEYIRRIYGDLAEAGYDARWCVLGADDVGANHRRKRWWILAYSAQFGRRRWNNEDDSWESGTLQAEGSCARNKQRDVAESIKPTGGGRGIIGDSRDNKWGATKTEPASLQPKDGETYPGDLEQSSQDVSDTKKQNDGRGEAGEDRGQIQQPGQYQSLLSTPGRSGETGSQWWAVEPQLGRVAHGVAHRVDRLKAIGNGQVPAVVRAVWGILTQ